MQICLLQPHLVHAYVAIFKFLFTLLYMDKRKLQGIVQSHVEHRFVSHRLHLRLFVFSLSNGIVSYLISATAGLSFIIGIC